MYVSMIIHENKTFLFLRHVAWYYYVLNLKKIQAILLYLKNE